MKFRKSILYIILAAILCIIPAQGIHAASGITLTYDGKTVLYKGQQVSYTVDGKKVALKTPGVIFNGVSLVSYKEVFETAMGADCNYNSKKNTLTIRKFNQTIQMTIGSRTALVNGNKITLPIAPKKIKYVKTNTTKIAVPARTVAEALGYSYTWLSKQSKVEIKSPYQISYNNKWYLYTGPKGKVMADGHNINVSKMPGVLLDNVCFVQASAVFSSKYINASYQYDSASKKVTLEKDDRKIIYQINSKTATVNGKKYTLDLAPRFIKDNVSHSARVMIPAKFTAEMLGYQYTWDKATKTSVITSKNSDSSTSDTNSSTKEDISDEEVNSDEEGGIDEEDAETIPNEPKDEVNDEVFTFGNWENENQTVESPFTNLLQSIHVYGDSSKEVLEITGKTKLTPIITEDKENKNIIFMDFERMQNDMGDIKASFPKSKYIKSIKVSYDLDTTLQIEIEKTDESDYYGVLSGNHYSLTFKEKTTSPSDNSENENTAASSKYTVQIPKPSDVSFQEILDEDCYLEKKIKVVLPGDHIDFYNNNPITIKRNDVYVKYQLNSSGDTEIILTTSAIQGYKVYDTKNSISLQIGDPNKIYSRIVVLDPGHGGSDPGTSKSGFKEKDITYNILYQYGSKYFNSPDSNIKVYWTRVDDTYIPLTDRAKFASQVNADIFISLHLNSASATSANGTETYYSTNNNDTNAMGLSSKELADFIQEKLPKSLGLSSSRGVKTAKFAVIKNNSVPAILIELGFVTNQEDLKKLSDSSFQDNAAYSLYSILEELFDQYPTGR